MRHTPLKLLAAALVCFGALAPGWAQKPDAGPIKVGLLLPIKSAIGKQAQQGADLAAEMLNEQKLPDGRKLSLIVYDDNYSPVEAVSAAQRLISQDKVSFIAGSVSSTSALAVLQVARAGGILYFAAIPKHPDLTSSGYDRVFRMNTRLDQDVAYIEAMVRKKLKPTKLAMVVENTDYGRFSLDSATKSFGPALVAGETFELTQNDFSTIMSKVKASGADVVCLVAGKPEHAAAALRAMAQIGLKAKRCGAVSVLNPQTIALAGEAAEGAVGADMYNVGISTAVNQEFVKRFTTKYGAPPAAFELLGFESVWVLGKGIQAAGTTEVAKVAEALHKGKFDTPRGTIVFDRGGQAISDKYVDLVVTGGKMVITD